MKPDRIKNWPSRERPRERLIAEGPERLTDAPTRTVDLTPYFFAAWFNSLAGKQLVEQRSTGGINPFLGLGNLREMPFPIVDPREHKRIGDLVQETLEEAYAAERKASDLLKQAKRKVEEVIERT